MSNAAELSTVTYVYTPTWRSTHIEFLDVATIGATCLVMKSHKTRNWKIMRRLIVLLLKGP